MTVGIRYCRCESKESLNNDVITYKNNETEPEVNFSPVSVFNVPATVPAELMENYRRVCGWLGKGVANQNRRY